MFSTLKFTSARFLHLSILFLVSFSFSGLLVSGKRINIFDTPNCDLIETNLYLGNARAACDPKTLQSLNITHILTIDNQPVSKCISSRKNLTYLYIKACDSPHQNLLNLFPVTNEFIEDAVQNGSILVHCHHGISRSSAVVIAYCMRKYNIDYDRALKYVRRRRSFVQPNPGFVEQLQEYHNLDFYVKVNKLECIHLKATKHKYKLASAAMLLACMLIPLAVFI